MAHFIEETVRTLPAKPGVYRMLDAAGQVLYVGKARSLRTRVRSYLRARGLTARILSMMRSVTAVDVTVTHTEAEALLLENNLIKTLKPRYNVLLRDDKSYPYIFLAESQDFPRLAFHRGARNAKGRYFGPFPSASAVRESLQLLQKIFLVRQCKDSFFRNRSRPCLQYQIGRCSGPCVGLISPEDYRRDVRHTILFLEGQSRTVVDEMVHQMEQAAEAQNYEGAARFRDRIAALKRIQARQYVSREGGDADVVAVATLDSLACVEVVFIRGGLNLGSKRFFPTNDGGLTPEEMLAAFLPLYYLEKTIPSRVYLDRRIPGRELLAQVFSEQMGRAVRLSVATRGTPRRWAQMAALNATQALQRRQADKAGMLERFDALRERLGLDQTPEWIECFDISHTFGEATVASCVAFDQTGPVKADYRRYNIEGVKPGDDYGAIRQALTRRFRHLRDGEGKAPDVLLIDGGKGQVGAAAAVLEEYQLGGIRLVGVAKGRSRRPGREQLFLSGAKTATILPADSPALHLIQHVRDEAHRFAITGHRQRRARSRTTSALQDITGIGDRRRQALLKNFGGLQGVARAGVEDLARVPGISAALAQRIYDSFHD